MLEVWSLLQNGIFSESDKVGANLLLLLFYPHYYFYGVCMYVCVVLGIEPILDKYFITELIPSSYYFVFIVSYSYFQSLR
jgi:hypothetical protein